MPVNDQTPDVVLYDSNGVEMNVSNGVATPVGTRGLIVAGTDGTTTRFISTDTSGRQITVGAAAAGVPPIGNPQVVAGSDGNVRVLKTDATGQLYVITGGSAEQATWSALAPAVQIGNNKSMISILNATGTVVVIRLREIWVENVQTTPVTGVTGFFEVHRNTGHSAGTLLTSLPYDTTDTLDANVTVRTGATIAGEAAGVLVRHVWSTDDWSGGTLDGEQYEHGIQASTPFWSRKDISEKPITLRSGQGLTVKFTTNSTNGTFDLTLVFTQAST